MSPNRPCKPLFVRVTTHQFSSTTMGCGSSSGPTARSASGSNDILKVSSSAAGDSRRRQHELWPRARSQDGRRHMEARTRACEENLYYSRGKQTALQALGRRRQGSPCWRGCSHCRLRHHHTRGEAVLCTKQEARNIFASTVRATDMKDGPSSPTEK